MSKNGAVETSKDVMGGTPVFPGTRVPVRTLLDYLEGGDTLDQFLADFPTVKREQVIRVMELIKDNLAHLVA